MSGYFGLFVTNSIGRIKSYNGNFYKLNQLREFKPEGAYIDDFFHELSPHNDDFYSSFDIIQASMAHSTSMLPTSFRQDGKAVLNGHISSTISNKCSIGGDAEITWFFWCRRCKKR